MERKQSIEKAGSARRSAGSAELAVLACLAAALTLGCAAGQPSATARPWLKPPEQWTQADADQILVESPWIKRVKRAFGHLGQFESFDNVCNAVVPMTFPSDPPMRAGCVHERIRTGTGVLPSDSGIQVDLTFTWESEAICRAWNWSSNDVHCRESGEHVILVQGQNVPLVLYVELESGRRISGVKKNYGFSFPTRNSDGTPTIGPNEKSAKVISVVHYKSREYRIEVKFDLRKMVTAKGRDL